MTAETYNKILDTRLIFGDNPLIEHIKNYVVETLSEHYKVTIEEVKERFCFSLDLDDGSVSVGVKMQFESVTPVNATDINQLFGKQKITKIGRI